MLFYARRNLDIIPMLASIKLPKNSCASSKPRKTENKAECFCISFQKIIFLITTKITNNKFCINLNIVITIAISLYGIKFYIVIRGNQKHNPMLILVIIQKMIIFAQLVLASKLISKPKPRVIIVIPNQISGRYLPVFLIKALVTPAVKEIEKTKAKKQMPEKRGIAPRTAWK